MQLRIWKRVYLSPFVHLNLYTRGFSISFGRRRIGWITFSKRTIRETLHTPVPGVCLSEGQLWQEIAAGSPKRDRPPHP
jgi:hypothetical protein